MQPSDEISMDQFASLVLGELTRVHGDMGFAYAEDDQSIRGEAGGPVVYLANLIVAYRAGDDEARTTLLQRIARVTEEVEDVGVEEARGHLRTKVWTRYHLEFPRLQSQVEGEDSDVDFVSVPRWEFGEHLMGLLVLDEEDRVSGVSHEMIEAWGGNAAELCDEAEMRTASLVEAWGVLDAEGGGPGRLIIPDLDATYASSAFLCTAAFERLGLAEGALASAPTRGSFFVVEPGDIQLEVAFLDAIEVATEEDSHPLCPVPLEWRQGRWRAWAAPAGHPLGARYRNLERVFLHQVYDEQKELLDRLHAARGEDVFVATHSLHEREGEDDYVSLAVWSRGVDTLLPRSDRVGFVDLALEPPMQLEVDWEDAVRVAGDLMEEVPGMHPRRYAVRSFPEARDLQVLREQE